MIIEYAFGLPVASAANVLEVFGSLGIRPWKPVEEMSVEAYLEHDLTPQQLEEFRRYSKFRAGTFDDSQGRRRTFFYIRGGRVYTVVFVLLPGAFVPVTASFRPALGRAGEIKLQLPSGGVKAGESPEACAQRECLEESGIVLARAEVVAKPIPISVGFSDDLIIPCLGIPHEPVQWKSVSPDAEEGEMVNALLLPLAEWFKAMVQGATDLVSISATFFGLRKLGVRVEI